MDQDIKKTMEFKAKQIKKAQDNKEESIKIASSGRDAVLVVTNYRELYKDLSEEDIKEKLIEWRKWCYVNLYDTPIEQQLISDEDPF